MLGVIGPVAAFGLFYIGLRVLDLGNLQLETLMFLLLVVAGHMTIFLTRTRGPFWSVRPATVLVVAVFGAQAIGLVISAYGVLVPAIGWGLALLVWGYAMGWFLLTDRIKLLAYRLIDPPQTRANPARAAPRPT